MESQCSVSQLGEILRSQTERIIIIAFRDVTPSLNVLIMEPASTSETSDNFYETKRLREDIQLYIPTDYV